MTTERSATNTEPDSMEALYPFLYSDTSDLDAVMSQVRDSTAAKANDIVELRERVLDTYRHSLVECAHAMAGRFNAGGRLFACGNGGSSTDAQDMAGLFLSPAGGHRPLPAFGMTSDIAVVTALSNDVSFDVVFARQIAAFGRDTDIVAGLSTSGNSANLLQAFDEASRRGMITIGIAGYDGGKMAEHDSIDYLFNVPSPSVHRIQEAQTTIYHAVWELTIDALGAAHVPDGGDS